MLDFCCMNFMQALKYFIIIFLLSAVTVKAQQGAGTGGSVSGKLVDATNNQPLSFASVALYRKADNKSITGLQTDIDGNFKLSNISDGAYVVRITYVSYLTINKDSIIISPRKRVYELGTVKMRPAKGVLKEVTVTAQRSQIQLGIDKKSFNVDQSLVSQGGSATDLLTNVPSVQVDVDGNISLRGSNNVRVLINGKPSALTGSSLTDILQSIPASSIETIEVITNPSSKYEAEGDSGIINIVLKKNASIGFTGSASGSIGTQNTYNGNVNLSFQNKKINIYTNYSYRQANRIGNGFTDRTTTSPNGGIQLQNQIGNQEFDFSGHNIRSGIDYNFNENNTLSFSNNINIRSRNRYQDGATNITDGGLLSQQINQNNVSKDKGVNLDFSLDYDHKFKKPQEELTISADYSNGHDTNYDNFYSNYYYYSLPSYDYTKQNNSTINRQHFITLQSDYTLPLKNGRLEAGYRSTFNKSDNNYIADTASNVNGLFNFDPYLSNRFVYNENVNALYVNLQHQFGNFGIQGGLRLEDANINTQLIDSATNNHKQDYWRLYPTLFLTEKLNDHSTLQLSYSRRVTRPRGNQLSPFLDVSNRLAYQEGNPNLLPEDTHSFELSYINYWKVLTLTSSLYYRLTNDNIQQITTPLTATNRDTTLTQFQNIKSASNAGFELIAKVTASSAIDLTANVNVYYKYITGDPAYNIATTSGYSYNGNLTANIKPVKKLGIQIRGDYQGSQVIPQGTLKPIYGVDGGIKYDLTKQLSLSGNVRDIFNTRKFASDIVYNTPGFSVNQVSQRRFATRTGIFTISYRFGSNSANRQQRQRNRDQQNQDIPDDPNIQPQTPSANPVAPGAPTVQPRQKS
jgi:outer membrane receptor protein involved in Fe transport